MFKNHCNQNKYVRKTYVLKQFSANFHTNIKLRVVFLVLDTFSVFVNKNRR